MKEFIQWAQGQLQSEAVVTKEKHGDQSEGYHLSVPSGNYFLKIGVNLDNERNRINWLNGKLPVPKIIGFMHIDGKDAILMTSIDGSNLAKLKREWDGDKVVQKLAEILRKFHATDIVDCPFGEPGMNKVLVHGDACLPNFIFKGDEFSGYIDLGDMRIGTVDVDLCAAIWSLQFNLGPGYGIKFLEKYGVTDATEEMVENLRLQYEDVQKSGD